MPANEPSDLIKAAFHEAGHAAAMGLTGIARVFAITVDTDMSNQHPDGEVEKEWLKQPSDDELAMLLLAGPLAELKCIANHEQKVAWKFHPETAIKGIAVHEDDVSATFEDPGKVTYAVTVDSSPFETDFGQVREKAAGAVAIIDQRVKLTQAWLDDPIHWQVVTNLAKALIGLKGKPVLRRQLFGPQVTNLFK